MASLTPELQFEHAETTSDAAAPSGVTCVGCKTEITSYYEVNGSPVCERCRSAVLAARRAPHAGPMLRATGLGLVAAVAGSLIYYAIAELTGYEFGLISIVVGLMVGFAVRKGARARGGWRYQALAMFLTYAAIASTYVPRVLEAVRQERGGAASAPATAPAAATDQGAPAEPAAAQGTEAGAMSGGQLLVALGLLIVFALALPFLAGFDNIMGRVLIAIALYEAWKVNRAARLQISGPYQVGARTPAA